MVSVIADTTATPDRVPAGASPMSDSPHELLPQQLSPAYVLAEKDVHFLARDELRPVRLQLELLKPEMTLEEQGIDSTIVVFGSARLPAPEEAAAYVQRAEERLAAEPDNPYHRRRLEGAKRLASRTRYYEEARKFGSIVSSTCQVQGKCDYVVVTGGGPGVMEAANRGAHDVLAKSVGLNIKLPFEQYPNRYITPSLCFNFHYFALRKMHFLMRAKALVCFPGGFGTMDELFECLTLIQTGKMQRIPVLLFGKEFWDDVVHFERFVDEGTISPEDLELFTYVETAEEAWDRITAFHQNHRYAK